MSQPILPGTITANAAAQIAALTASLTALEDTLRSIDATVLDLTENDAALGFLIELLEGSAGREVQADHVVSILRPIRDSLHSKTSALAALF